MRAPVVLSQSTAWDIDTYKRKCANGEKKWHKVNQDTYGTIENADVKKGKNTRIVSVCRQVVLITY